MGSIYDEQLLKELEREEHELTLTELLLLLAFIRGLRSSFDTELRKFYQKYGKDGVVTYAEARKWVSDKDHRRRLTWLLALTSTQFTSLYSDMRKEFDKMLNGIIEKEFGFFGVALDKPKVNWGVDGLTYIDRLADNISAWEAYVASDIKRGILSKKTIDEISEILDKRFLTMENVTKRLAVTETTAVGSIARKEAFKALGISKYKYYAREDERTCEQCGALHGLVFPISAYEPGVTASPLHSNCRCWEVPIRE